MFLLNENLIRALEILSVTPAFLRGLLEKEIYLRTLKTDGEFEKLVSAFMRKTEDSIAQNKITPAGFYTGVWCRDASYILNELTQMDKETIVAYWLQWIWNHQLRPERRAVYGRGSPEMGYRLTVADDQYLKNFAGSLPSSIQFSYDEVYAKSPDIDSTALMILTTCRFLLKYDAPEGLTEQLLPKIRDAVASLERRDIDGDSLLEQGPNEDWMDNMLRSGKIVYSQAAWILALKDWHKLLDKLGNNKESEITLQKYRNVVKQVNAILWQADSAYADKLDEHQTIELATDDYYDDKSIRISQDISLLLLIDDLDRTRVLSTLSTIKSKLWRELGVSCTQPVTETGPQKLRPYNYQNGGFWPWITSLEVLARLNQGDLENSVKLLNQAILYSPFEWVNPYTKRGGSFPFKTGISAVRIAVREYLNAKQ